MSLLRTLESKIESLVEGTFGRVFRSQVRPIELARKLVREMDEHRTPSVSRIYAPHEYDVWLSPEDRDHYEGIEPEVIDELSAYLLEHARRERLTLAGRPAIRFHPDHQLNLGEFGIETHPVRLDEQEALDRRTQGHSAERAHAAEEDRGDEWVGGLPENEAQEESIGHTIVQRASGRRMARRGGAADHNAGALLLLGGRRLLVPTGGAVVGRSRDCDIVLDDSGVSRRHAEILPDADGWSIEDLGSTNGLRVNGRSVRGLQQLHPGDRIVIGSTEIVFELR
jgi:hypothetical protein